LFNAINQRDSIIAQRYNDIQKRIATSTKEDSISMTTFTFITALFLPGTFICALLSLTMIEWQPDFLTASNPTASATNAGESGSGNTTISIDDGNGNGNADVSKYFWVFWVIDIPLTFLVLLGWWLWFKRTKTAWMKENNIDPSKGEESESDSVRGKRKGGKSVSVSSQSTSPSRRSRRSGQGSVSSFSSRASGSTRGSGGTGESVRSRRSGGRSGTGHSSDEDDVEVDKVQVVGPFKGPKRTTTWKTDDEIEIFPVNAGDSDREEGKSLSLRVEPVSRRGTGLSTTSKASRPSPRDKEHKTKRRGSAGYVTGEKLERVESSRSEGDKGKRLRRVTESKVGEDEDKVDEKQDAATSEGVQKSFTADLRDRLAKARRGGRTEKEKEDDLEQGRKGSVPERE
jgi:hypothetical protein